MKRLLQKLFVFLLPFLLIYSILEYQLSQLPSSYSQRKKDFESQLADIEILSTGSSHGNAINPIYFDQQGFNLNNDAQDLYYDTRLVEKYLEKLPKLRIILMPISYFSIEYQIGNSLSAWREPFYTLIWGINPQYISKLNIRYLSFTAAYGWKKVLNYLITGDIDVIMIDQPKKINKNGWGDYGNRAIQENEENEREGWQSVSINESFMRKELRQQIINLLSDFLEKCRLKNIYVVFLTTPTHHYYYEHVDPFKYKELQDTMMFLINKFHVSYFDYLKDARFTNIDFYNIDHLNSIGVEKLTRIIKEEVVDPLIN